MSLAVLKLESFGAGMAAQGVPLTFSREALDQAFSDGLAEGMARQQDDQVRTLSAGLDRLAQALAADEARRADLRRARAVIAPRGNGRPGRLLRSARSGGPAPLDLARSVMADNLAAGVPPAALP